MKKLCLIKFHYAILNFYSLWLSCINVHDMISLHVNNYFVYDLFMLIKLFLYCYFYK